LKVATPVAHLS